LGGFHGRIRFKSFGLKRGEGQEKPKPGRIGREEGERGVI